MTSCFPRSAEKEMQGTQGGTFSKKRPLEPPQKAMPKTAVFGVFLCRGRARIGEGLKSVFTPPSLRGIRHAPSQPLLRIRRGRRPRRPALRAPTQRIHTTLLAWNSAFFFRNRCCVFVGVDAHGDPPCLYGSKTQKTSPEKERFCCLSFIQKRSRSSPFPNPGRRSRKSPRERSG